MGSILDLAEIGFTTIRRFFEVGSTGFDTASDAFDGTFIIGLGSLEGFFDA